MSNRSLSQFCVILVQYCLIHLVAVSASAQTVESLPLSPGQNIDGLFIDSTGTLFGAGTFSGSAVFEIGSGGEVSTFASGFDGPILMTKSVVDGNYYVTNFNGASVSRVTPSGEVSTFASVKAGPSGIVSDKDGNLYISHYGTGNGTGNSITKITPDGTVSDFAVGGTINVPVAITIDDEGTIYTGNLFDGRITQITSDGEQSLFSQVAAVPPFAIGHLIWIKGKMYGAHVGEHRIYEFDSDGNATVLAGTGEMGQADGPASMATFSGPNGIAASITGDTLYVAQAFGQTQSIRMIILATATSIDDEGQVPYESRLVSSYPNPSASTITLEFELDQPAFAQLEVYNVQGQRITTLVQHTLSSGVHRLQWDAENVVPGVYYYRMQVNGRVDVGKMIRL